MAPKRRQTRRVRIGSTAIGASEPVRVQSMTSTPASDREATLAQARRLEEAGCEILRFAVPSKEALPHLEYYKSRLGIPIVADIHFDHRLALGALERGADKIRINPGNLGSEDRFREVLDAVLKQGAALRIGVNSGSLEKELLDKFKHPCAEALVESAMNHLRVAQEVGVENVVVSIKSSDVLETVKACRLFSHASDVPQHLGITEAGLPAYGSIKSAVGLGTLLLAGIGDTIRVSLTGDPVAEVQAGFDILKAAGVRIETPEIISCPTCGRMQSDMARVALEISNRLAHRQLPIRVAVMGCAVNGPGEAREADIGIAGGKGFGMLFRKGTALRKVTEDSMVEELMQEIDCLEADMKNRAPENR
ncbi:MAG: flavodoxin-dependent (E)-4-hydroxy-3-methylbut-2-enyl-diphosphate synthase [Planctomycetota bacterium]|jgi:(E)-4-hydroxy-3-methylbut-2-enyl-diphosphate synthase